ncbi:hypothetical protein NKI41_00270 [Mesorhizobium sp. M0601]|uniref:hypothetical protein n=1 Tax=Mesorhizobium sp. M0601 TaxID=2956969 RepID=UPI00333B281B
MSGISFDRNEIIGNGNWPLPAQDFIRSIDELQVVDLINEHFKLAKNFFGLLPHRTGIATSTAYRDYNKICLANKICSHIMSLGLILQFAIPKMLDPYEYLDGHFSKLELDNIYSFKNNSKVQVDYIISLRDPIGLLDQHTKEQLYKLFSVSIY